jgi:alanine racemase
MLTLSEFQQQVGGTLLQQSAENSSIQHVLIDSRKLIYTEHALFIAIKGERNNGHLYLQEVYDAGVRNFMVEANQYDAKLIQSFKNCNVLEIENGISSLQKFAQLHRASYDTKVCAVTGSNGKTIVKEWLTHLLKDKLNIVRNPKSYNSQIGVPLSVLQMNASHTLGIFEAGISEPNEMPVLEEIIQPQWGVFTYLGDAHNEGFSTEKEKLKEKALLFTHCKTLIYPAEQELVHDYFSKEFGPAYQVNCIGWSRFNPQAHIYIHQQTVESETHLSIKNQSIRIPFTDDASVWNVCCCLALLYAMEIPIQSVQDSCADLPVLEMRLQLKEAHQDAILINDAYSADLGSLGIALDFLNQHAGDYKRIVILSDFLESGKSEESLYQSIAQLLDAHHIDELIGVGTAISRNAHWFHQEEQSYFQDTAQLLNNLSINHFNHAIILLKGARQFTFEKVAKWLERKVHQTVFEINLNALVHNLHTYRSILKPKVKVMAMVKAFSYGAGSYEIARILNFNRVDYLTVAYADEGVVLRKAGIRTPIMVMNPEPQSFDAILQYNLEPEVYQFDILQSLIQSADGVEVGIHIELDSGMKRLGFDAAQIPALIQKLTASNNLKIKSVFTHLAASEDPSHDEFTLQQIMHFKELSQQILDAFPYPILRHCLNSGGIARFPDAQLDMVRLGIGLYGVDPSPKHLALQPIGTLKTVVSQIRDISSSESIGYGRKGKLPQAGKIAIVAIGYADGLDRKLSNGVGAMNVNGKMAKIVGNICMDMTMLDVTNIPCKPGDEVIVFGQMPSIETVSDQIQTIPYEVLTGVSQRVKRVYYYE